MIGCGDDAEGEFENGPDDERDAPLASDLDGDDDDSYDESVCSACGATFNRRDRVVDTYGPEAFLPDQPKPAKATVGKSRYRRAMILTVLRGMTKTVSFQPDSFSAGRDPSRVRIRNWMS